jgi:hypothetical protein
LQELLPTPGTLRSPRHPLESLELLLDPRTLRTSRKFLAMYLVDFHFRY